MDLLNEVKKSKVELNLEKIEKLVKGASQGELNEALLEIVRKRYAKTPELVEESVITRIVKLLLINGADPNCRDSIIRKVSLDDTPLHWAAFLGLYDVSILLIQCGADVLAINNQSQAPLDSYSDQNQHVKDPSPATRTLLAELVSCKRAHEEYIKNKQDRNKAQAAFAKLASTITPKVLSVFPGMLEEVFTVALVNGLRSQEDSLFQTVQNSLGQLRKGDMPIESKAAGDTKEITETKQNGKVKSDKTRSLACIYTIFIQLIVFNDVETAKKILGDIASEPEKTIMMAIFALEEYFAQEQNIAKLAQQPPIKKEILESKLFLEYLTYKEMVQPLARRIKFFILMQKNPRDCRYLFSEEEQYNFYRYLHSKSTVWAKQTQYYVVIINDSDDEILLGNACEELLKHRHSIGARDEVRFATAYLLMQDGKFKEAIPSLEDFIKSTREDKLKIKAAIMLSKAWHNVQDESAETRSIKAFSVLKDNIYAIANFTQRKAVIQELEISLKNIPQPAIKANIKNALMDLYRDQAREFNNFTDFENWIFKVIDFLKDNELHKSLTPIHMYSAYVGIYIQKAAECQKPIAPKISQLLQHEEIAKYYGVLNAMAHYAMAMKPVNPNAAAHYFKEAIAAVIQKLQSGDKSFVDLYFDCFEDSYLGLVNLYATYNFSAEVKESGFEYLVEGVQKVYDVTEFVEKLFNKLTSSMQTSKPESKGDVKAELMEVKEVRKEDDKLSGGQTKQIQENFYALIAPIEIFRAQGESFLALPQKDKSDLASACFKKAVAICERLLQLADKLSPKKRDEFKKIVGTHLVSIRQIKFDESKLSDEKKAELKETKDKRSEDMLEAAERKTCESAIKATEDKINSKNADECKKAVDRLLQCFDGLRTELFVNQIASKLFEVFNKQQNHDQFIYLKLKLLAKCPDLCVKELADNVPFSHRPKFLVDVYFTRVIIKKFATWRLNIANNLPKNIDFLILPDVLIQIYVLQHHKDISDSYKNKLISAMGSGIPNATRRAERIAKIKQLAEQQFTQMQKMARASNGDEKAATPAAATLGLSLNRSILNPLLHAASAKQQEVKSQENMLISHLVDSELSKALARNAKKEEIIKIINRADQSLLNKYLHNIIFCRQGHDKVIEVTCSHNPVIRDCTEHNVVESTLCSEEDIVEYTTVLLRRGANVNGTLRYNGEQTKNNYNFAPLHLAVRLGMYQVCVLLLEWGALLGDESIFTDPVKSTQFDKRYPKNSQITKILTEVENYKQLLQKTFQDSAGKSLDSLVNATTDQIVRIFPHSALAIAALYCPVTDPREYNQQKFTFWLNKWIILGRYKWLEEDNFKLTENLAAMIVYLRKTAQVDSPEIVKSGESKDTEAKSLPAKKADTNFNEDKTVALFSLFNIYLLVNKNKNDEVGKLIFGLEQGPEKEIMQGVFDLDKVLSDPKQSVQNYIKQLSRLLQQSSQLVDYLCAKANSWQDVSEVALHLLKQLALLNNPHVLKLPLFAAKAGVKEFLVAQEKLQKGNVHAAIVQFKLVIKNGDNDLRVNACLAVCQLYRDRTQITIGPEAVFNILLATLKIPLDKFQRIAVIDELRLLSKEILAVAPQLFAKIHMTVGNLLLAQAETAHEFDEYKIEINSVLAHSNSEEKHQDSDGNRLLRFTAACHFAEQALAKRQVIDKNILVILQEAASANYLSSYLLLARYYLTDPVKPDITQAASYCRQDIEFRIKNSTNYSIESYRCLAEIYHLYNKELESNQDAFCHLLAGIEAACKNTNLLGLLWQDAISSSSVKKDKADAKTETKLEVKADISDNEKNPFNLILAAIDMFLRQSKLLAKKAEAVAKKEADNYLKLANELCKELLKLSDGLSVRAHRDLLVDSLIERIGEATVSKYRKELGITIVRSFAGVELNDGDVSKSVTLTNFPRHVR